jgi:peptide/nickel transport system substrate-binding protein
MAQKLAGPRAIAVAVVVLGLGAAVWWNTRGPAPAPAADARGGTLVGTIRTEPRSFNRFVARDRTSNLVSLLLHDKLIHLNVATQQVEPGLAESWSSDADARTWTLHLRKNVVFSDGHPFTSDDVLFSLRAAYDEKTASPLGGSLTIDGKPLEASAPDPATVVITLPAPFGPGVRILDNLPILPRHQLDAALQAGSLRDAWALTTPPSEMAGLGAFILTEYLPGERLAFARNPHYWGRAADGTRLPHLDAITLVVVPDQDAELLRLESGDADLVTGEVRPEDLDAVKRATDQGRLRTIDAGVSLDADFLWFNLKPNAFPASRAWLQRRELREAISLAVDRHAFSDTVFLGAAVPIGGPVTPGNRDWYEASVSAPAQDLARARQLVAAAGLSDANGDGQLDAPDGKPARFSLLTQKGHTLRERSASFVQQDLQKLGLGVDVVALEAPALIDRVTSGAYEAAYFGMQASDTDPATNLDYWLSSGAFHPWNPGQARPSTAWEAEIDDLMRRQVAATDVADRKRLFGEVQRVFAREQPAIYFAAPRLTLATSARVDGVRAGLLQPYILWDAANLRVR